MALDLSKLNIFSRVSARARVFILFGTVIGMIVLIYVLTQYFSNTQSTLGPSSVANAPTNLKSIPGGQLTPEYSKALQQANTAAATHAATTGTSAVPTLLNYGMQQGAPAADNTGCVICANQAPSIQPLLQNWISHGALSPDVGDALHALAKKEVTDKEYATALEQLVREGKLSPDQARELLAQYKKQHEHTLLQQSANMMDALIKANQLPLEVANELLDAQKKHLSPEEYAALLQRLVREGKLSPEAAQQLLAQYNQQHTKEILENSILVLRGMTAHGEILPEIEKALIELEQQLIPVSNFAIALDQYVKAGKMIPVVANKILEEYKDQKRRIGSATLANIDQLSKQAEEAAYAEIRDLVQAGKLSPAIGGELTNLIQQKVSLTTFKERLDALVQAKQMTPDIAKLKLADYETIDRLRRLAAQLQNLQANNATNAEYAETLKTAVAAGVMTPEEAAQLMRAYQAARTPIAGPTDLAGPTTPDFAELSKRAAEGAALASPQNAPTSAQQFAQAQTATTQMEVTAMQANLDSMTTAMSGQAAQLVTAWQPTPMTHRENLLQTTPTASANGATATANHAGASANNNALPSLPSQPPLIKAGTILFAVLDTTANSDYPDSPVMATIVDGNFKGGTLIGKLVTAKGPAGQLDRMALNFTLMNMQIWPMTKTITAYAIDPDTARTVIASSVDYHYLQRFGAVMATSFLKGYADSITQAGTATTGIFGTTTTGPTLNPSQKVAAALGEVGKTLGSVTSNYVKIPPTVKVDAGVGLGILFVSDVSG